MNGVDDYRALVGGDDLVESRVRIRESDLLVRGDRDLERPAREALVCYRRQLEDYLYLHPAWGKSLFPVPAPGEPPPIVAAMTRSAALCGVGPMASVAGALAWFVGGDLSVLSGELIVENGGDIYLKSGRPRTILVGSGSGAFRPGQIGLRIPPRRQPIGIAASSGTGGRSLSWGRAAAAAVLAEDSIIADAAATALGNRVRKPERGMLEAAVDSIAEIPAVLGCLAVCGQLLAVRGEVELIDLSGCPGGEDVRLPETE